MNTEQMREALESYEHAIANGHREHDALSAFDGISVPDLVRWVLAITNPPEPARVGGVPDLGARVVNEACWKFVEAMPHHIPPAIWNALKPAIYAALAYYHEQMLTATPQAPADVVRDAERYRWLRDSENQRHEDDICVSDSYFNAFFGADLDAAIDAAMSTKAGGV
jgi:hypothetical protein